VIELAIISAGAAKAVVNAVRADFRDAGDAEVLATFGAVGAMRAQLLEGNPCDLIILTAPMIAELEHEGRAVAGTSAALGRVHTGIAVRAGTTLPVITDRTSLESTLINATSLYVPDTERSTAGRHVVKVLQALGIGAALAPRLRRFESGAIAMRELASSTDERALGCTQISEILYTPAVTLVGALPEAFDLATTYSAAIASSARHPELARRFLQVLTGPTSSDLRRHAGFEATEGLHNA